jgi:hypothetical protein
MRPPSRSRRSTRRGGAEAPAVTDDGQLERAVGPLSVVVPDVDAEDVLELATADDQQPVEAFAADGADPAFHVCVRVWCPDGCADDLDRLAPEERVEGVRELRVVIVDQEPDLPIAVVEMHQ